MIFHETGTPALCITKSETLFVLVNGIFNIHNKKKKEGHYKNVNKSFILELLHAITEYDHFKPAAAVGLPTDRSKCKLCIVLDLYAK